MNEIIEKEEINVKDMIYEIRGKQVIFAHDVAKLYNSETRIINQVVKRNINRFPTDFCFQLTEEEMIYYCSRSQFVILNDVNNKRGKNIKYLPYVFTEHGVMMISSLLKSDIAASVNVSIIKAFVEMKNIISNSIIDRNYIDKMVIRHDNEIKLLQESFNELSEKKNMMVYFLMVRYMIHILC